MPKESLYTGEKITIYYKIINKSILDIPYLEIQNNISKQLTGMDSPIVAITLKAKETYYHKEDIILKGRSFYELGEIEITVRDIFGIYSLQRKVSSRSSLLVYPEPINLSSFIITTVQQQGELLVEELAFQDKSRVSSLRDYREGDNIKSIHWKLSAKLDDLLVKDYENRGDTNVVVFIDNYEKLFQKDIDRHLEDKAADIGLSIVNYYINQNIPISIQTQDKEKIVEIYGQQRTDLKPFLIAFAKFKGNGFMNFETFLKSRIGTIGKGATVIIITPNLGKSIGTLGILLKSKYLKPLIIIIADKENKAGLIEPMVEEGLRKEGIPVYVIDYKTNIKEALEDKYG